MTAANFNVARERRRIIITDKPVDVLEPAVGEGTTVKLHLDNLPVPISIGMPEYRPGDRLIAVTEGCRFYAVIEIRFYPVAET